MSFLLGAFIGILLLIAYYNLPLKRAIRARRRAEHQRRLALIQLSVDCHKLYHDALLETPGLRYRQDVCWIEYHSKLADPKCDDPGVMPSVLSPEEIEKDTVMGASTAFPYKFRMREVMKSWPV